MFWTENHDIQFGLSYQPDGGKPEQILANSRINCQQVPEDGIHKCAKPGTCKCTRKNTPDCGICILVLLRGFQDQCKASFAT